MPWMAAAAVAGPIVGGLVGNLMSQGDKKKQQQAMKQALAELEAVGYPPDLSKALIVEELQRQGIYTPQLEEEITVAESEMAQIKEDPALRGAQMQALAMMQQRAQTGIGAEDRAALNEVRRQVQTDAEAKRQQIMQTMAARGQAGGGADLMAQLQASQGAADQAAAGSDVIMAQAQQRALEALGRSGQMAGEVRGQDFGVSSARAQALDERNRFLAQNAIARQSANVGALNQAQQLNLSEQQRLHEQNIANRRAEELRQVNEQGSYYDRKLGYAGAKANALTGQATQYGRQAAETQQQMAGIGSAIGTGVAGYAQGQANQDANQMRAAASGLVRDPVTGNWVKG